MSDEIRNQKLSVIVPVYNAEKYLDRCIQSILNQTYKIIELILVDDGSTDQSAQICNEWVEKDNRVFAYHVKNGGPSNARNFGLKVVTGRFVSFVDADDFLNLDMYEKMIDNLVKTKSGMAVCKWTTHDLSTGTKKIVNIGSPRTVDALELKEIIATNDDIGGGGFLWNKVIDQNKVKASLKTDINFHNELKIYEDKIWLMELLDYIDKVVLVDTIGYNYEVKKNSLSHGNFSEKINDFLLALDVIEKECFCGFRTEEREIYEAGVTIFWFWKARKEARSASIVSLWKKRRSHVKKVLRKLSLEDVIKFLILDSILKLDNVLK